MQALYAYKQSGDEASHIIEHVLSVDLEDASLQFATSLFLKSLGNQHEAEVIISRHTKNWDFSRIALLDRILLQIAITELLFFPDIPPKVTINECIEIAKMYSTDQSGKFINGIMDAILNELRRDGTLNKAGRGLIDTTLSPTTEPKKGTD